jgi:(p)ppGpp synthase/HD superfamily hydrolase
MPDLQRLISEASLHLDPPERQTVHRAFEVALARHEGQFRTSGEPYILHPVEVAHILSTYRLDAPTLASALLHDVVEDTGATLEDLREDFGEEVAMLVDGVTKLTSISSRQTRDAPQPLSKKAAQAENLRKIFLAMARDLRVILIKLADRLHNMRTLGALRPDKKARIAQETLEIFAPIRRVGEGGPGEPGPSAADRHRGGGRHPPEAPEPGNRRPDRVAPQAPLQHPSQDAANRPHDRGDLRSAGGPGHRPQRRGVL